MSLRPREFVDRIASNACAKKREADPRGDGKEANRCTSALHGSSNLLWCKTGCPGAMIRLGVCVQVGDEGVARLMRGLRGLFWRPEEPAMIDILSLNGSGELLRKMTPAERGLFLLFGYASNQVNVLWKLVIVATNETPENPIEARVSAAQTQIIVRLVIGVLWEAWRLVQGRFLSSELGKEFVPKLDPAAKEALDRLKKEFGGSNMMVTVRNEYCFHYPKPEEMENAFQRAMGSGEMEELDWGVYFSRKLLNVFFFVSDYVFAHGVSSAIAEASVAEAHEKLLMSLGPIANDLSEVAYGLQRRFSRNISAQR